MMPAMKSGSFFSLIPLAELSEPLLRWYDSVHANRDMPWRQTQDPYAIWLSETMLQQTQVETVKPYYRRFLERFPTIADLAAAPLEEVLAMWAGLGYYRRAKHLHRAAQQVVREHEGRLPGTMEGLANLPGVGRYTAGAVGSIAFGLPVAVVDGNVMRVLARLTGFDGAVGDGKSREFFWEKARGVVDGTPGKRYGDVNQALMELGATVCVAAPARPACLVCPVRDFCRAAAEGRQMELPVKAAKKKTPVVRGAAVVVLRCGRRSAAGGQEVLLVRRPEGGIWEGMWEFPVLEGGSGKKEVRSKNIQRWGREKLGLIADDMADCGEVRHQLTHRLMVYRVVRCRVNGESGSIEPPACGGGEYREARWVNWPLVSNGPLPMARVVHKIAEMARKRVHEVET
jgi:A/G-specific adenine glycosylase